MKLEAKMRLRYAIAIIIWLIVVCVGIDKAFLRYICANPVPYDPVTNHPYTCMPPYTTLGSIVIFLGIIVGATVLAALYWKFGLPRGGVHKSSSEDHSEPKA